LPPPRLYENQALEPADLFFHPDAAVKIHQVGATTQQHVLAVVHHFAGAGMLVGGGAAAKIGAALEEAYPKTGLRQGAPCRQPRQAAAGNRYGGGGLIGRAAHALKRRARPRVRIPTFSARLNRTFSLKTS